MRKTAWFWTHLLLAADKVLGTHLVEWELVRRQRKIRRLSADIDEVNRELDVMAEGLAFCRLMMCVIALKARSERNDVDDWLRFSPESDGDEALLDSAVECLVKVQLANIDTEPTGSGHYVYRLHPDWCAILTHLRNASAAPEWISWLEYES